MMTNHSDSATPRKCAGTKANGAPCGHWPLKGSNVCKFHGGTAPQVRKKALVRAEVMAWGLTDEKVNPGEILLRLVAQSARRAERYALLLEADYEDRQVASLVGSSYSEGGKTGEYVRGLALLEAQERDRCAKFAHLAHTAGIAEEQIRLAQTYAAMIVTVLRASMVELGWSPDDPRVKEVVARQLRALPA